jgi:hypothetical protein
VESVQIEDHDISLWENGSLTITDWRFDHYQESQYDHCTIPIETVQALRKLLNSPQARVILDKQ